MHENSHETFPSVHTEGVDEEDVVDKDYDMEDGDLDVQDVFNEIHDVNERDERVNQSDGQNEWPNQGGRPLG